MTSLQPKFYSIPVGIENITASAHITYQAHITPPYPMSDNQPDKKYGRNITQIHVSGT